MPAISASPIGTSSVGRRSRRNMRSASTIGGSSPPARRRLRRRSRRSRRSESGALARGLLPRAQAAAGADRAEALMLAYAIRRVLLMVPTLLGIMVVNFFVIQAAPGRSEERRVGKE